MWLRTSLVGLAAFCLAGCTGLDPGMIHSKAEEVAVTSQVADLTFDALQRETTGEPLTGKDLENLEAALPLMERLARYEPAQLEKYALKGKILKALGRLDEALAIFRTGLNEAVRRDDNETKLILGDIYAEIVSIHMKKQEYQEAERVAAMMLRFTGNDAPYLTLAAQVKVQLGKTNEAFELANRAILDNAEYGPARALYSFLKSVREGAPSSAPKP